MNTSPLSLEASYRYSQSLAKRTAKNFYYSFMGLPPECFQSMCVLYAFMRICDDIGDDESVDLDVRRERLQQWREQLRVALAEDRYQHDVFPALVETVRSHHLPPDYLYAVIDGVSTDLEPHEIATFDQLAQYCYCVAGAVGLCCIHIWGFDEDERAINAAIDCGMAFQLTNILRDIAEDSQMGRVYLPRDELARFGYSIEDLQQGRQTPQFRELMTFQAERARKYYDRANDLFDYLSPTGKPILRAMVKIYSGLLDEIEQREYDVFSERISLPKWRKLLIAAESVVRQPWLRRMGSEAPSVAPW